jgi:hypothetical protein
LHEEKERLARSMGVCRNRDVLQQVLEFAMSDEIRWLSYQKLQINACS